MMRVVSINKVTARRPQYMNVDWWDVKDKTTTFPQSSCRCISTSLARAYKWPLGVEYRPQATRLYLPTSTCGGMQTLQPLNSLRLVTIRCHGSIGTVLRTYCNKQLLLFIITLAASSGKRNATVWRQSVRLSVCPIPSHPIPSAHTQRDTPEGSTRRGQRTFRSSITRTDTIV